MSGHRLLSAIAFVPGLLAAAAQDGVFNCSVEHISVPSLFGGEITSFTAAPVTNYSTQTNPTSGNAVSLVNFTGLAFCNVSVVYTHPGWNDSIHTQIWLPTVDSWNGRFQGTGGGGFIAGVFDSALAPAVSGKQLIGVQPPNQSFVANDTIQAALLLEARMPGSLLKRILVIYRSGSSKALAMSTGNFYRTLGQKPSMR